MEYIVFDLEFNQGYNRKTNKTISNEKCPFEILQIGAIKLDSNLNILDTFDSFVKPSIYKEVHPFIRDMTNITYEQVKDAPTFPEVYKSFRKFISSSKKTTFCVWGSNDLKELYRNIYFYGLPCKNIPKSYINVQQYASQFFNNPAGRSIGLKNAISILGLDQKASYHNALNDAYYTAQVFIRINNSNIVSDTYIYTPVKVLQKNAQIDYKKLYLEFEKILQKTLSEEDKKVIDLAYKMGKENRFSPSSHKYKKR